MRNPRSTILSVHTSLGLWSSCTLRCTILNITDSSWWLSYTKGGRNENISTFKHYTSTHRVGLWMKVLWDKHQVIVVTTDSGDKSSRHRKWLVWQPEWRNCFFTTFPKCFNSIHNFSVQSSISFRRAKSRLSFYFTLSSSSRFSFSFHLYDPYRSDWRVSTSTPEKRISTPGTTDTILLNYDQNLNLQPHKCSFDPRYGATTLTSFSRRADGSRLPYFVFNDSPY